jgi:hypothetical protein
MIYSEKKMTNRSRTAATAGRTGAGHEPAKRDPSKQAEVSETTLSRTGAQRASLLDYESKSIARQK